MEKWMCYSAIGVAALMALVFVMDLVAGVPFGGDPFVVVDIFGFLGALVVGYLGYNSLKDLK